MEFFTHAREAHNTHHSEKLATKARSFILFEVAPTAMQDGYPDILMSTYFNTYISLINSERQTIWTRYLSMLFVNSIIMIFVEQRALKPHEIEHVRGFLFIIEELAPPAFGFILCVFWWVLTKSAWKSFRMQQNEAARFVWRGVYAISPMEIARTYHGRIGHGVTYMTARFTILLFGFAYLSLFLLVFIYFKFPSWFIRYLQS